MASLRYRSQLGSNGDGPSTSRPRAENLRRRPERLSQGFRQPIFVTSKKARRHGRCGPAVSPSNVGAAQIVDNVGRARHGKKYKTWRRPSGAIRV